MFRPVFNPLSSAILILGLYACKNAPTEPTDPNTKEADIYLATTDAICAADATWISNPNMPTQVADTESFCDFYQFSWQWFLAETQPSGVSGERVWEINNRVVKPAGGPNQCASTTDISGRAAVLKALVERDNKPDVFEAIQADGSPLYDQAGNVLYYSIFYSPQECQATSAGFVAGTVEIKMSWRILATADPTYFTMNASIPVTDAAGAKSQKDVILGLVGFHLVNWTSKHPEMIWATWEHKSNAPLCAGTSITPESGWSFASNEAATCLSANPSANGTLPAACSDFDLNNQPTHSEWYPSTGAPDEICQLFQFGTDSGVSANGNDNAANFLAITQLNTALVGPQGMITLLPVSDPMAVWANYRMVGALWTKDGQASGSPPVPSAQSSIPNSSSPQRGSLELANVTLETYEQGQTSFVPNCFGCHNYVVESPLGVSHIANDLLLPPM